MDSGDFISSLHLSGMLLHILAAIALACMCLASHGHC